MKKWGIPATLIGILVLGISFGGTDFSGNWKLDLDKSDFGQMPAPYDMTYTIKHSEPEISVEWMFDGEWGTLDGESKYSTDGKPVMNAFGQMEMESTAKWDGAVLKVHSTGDFGGGEMSFDDEWILSADGKTLTIKRTISSGMGDGTQTIVFAKQ